MPVISPRALLEGQEVEIFKLVAKDATTKQWSEWLRVPLEHAAARGDYDLVDRQLKAGANGRDGWRGCGRRTLLDAAAQGGNDDVVCALLQAGCGPDVNDASSSSRRSALYRAIVGKHAAAARRLLLAGADVNYMDPTDKHTPLYAAAVVARQDGLVRDLLIAGARPNVRTGCYYHRTPLHGAAELGLEKIVAALLGSPSTDKDAFDKRYGHSPLMLASCRGHLSTVTTLVEAGADLSLRDEFERHSALDMAAEYGCVRVMTALLDHGADVNDAGGTWGSLHCAAISNQAECVQVLVDAGADLEQRDSMGETPLHYAAQRGSGDALLALLRQGADPNASSFSGSTALHFTADGDSDSADETVDLLLRWGASEQALDDNGKTPAKLLRKLKRECERAFGHEVEELTRALELLASAPADRAWRRRCWLVMLRARADRERTAAVRRSQRRNSEGGSGGGRARSRGRGVNTRVELRGFVDQLLGLESDGVFRKVVGYL